MINGPQQTVRMFEYWLNNDGWLLKSPSFERPSITCVVCCQLNTSFQQQTINSRGDIPMDPWPTNTMNVWDNTMNVWHLYDKSLVDAVLVHDMPQAWNALGCNDWWILRRKYAQPSNLHFGDMRQWYTYYIILYTCFFMAMAHDVPIQTSISLGDFSCSHYSFPQFTYKIP